MSDPSSVAQTLFVDDDVNKLHRVDGIVTVVGAAHVRSRLDERKPEGVENESVWILPTGLF